MRVVKKVVIDGIEFLPDIVYTDMFKEWERASYYPKGTKEIRLVAGFYSALARRENYFQENTPTAFGNPEYSLLEGIVQGFLQGSEMTMDEDNEHFIVKRGKQTVLIVDKIVRNPAFYIARRENEEVLSAILGG